MKRIERHRANVILLPPCIPDPRNMGKWVIRLQEASKKLRSLKGGIPWNVENVQYLSPSQALRRYFSGHTTRIPVSI